MSKLTPDLLSTIAVGGGVCCASRAPSGLQIGILRVGEGAERLTFPPGFVVDEAMRETWIRFATEEELPEAELQEKPNQWWRYAPFRPGTLIYEDGSVAMGPQPMGLRGAKLTAVEQIIEQPIEEVPCADVSDIPTPPSPPPRT